MLDSLTSLELRIDFGSGSSCCMVSQYSEPKTNGDAVPAAAAGSTGDLVSGVALSRGRERGLRSRPWSPFLEGGERDLRSKRDRLGSGSVWSNRDRFALRRSESSMMHGDRRDAVE